MACVAIEQRVVRTCESILTRQNYVSAVDILIGLGWLAPHQLDQWRQGRVSCLERSVQASLGKVSTAMGVFRGWAHGRDLIPRETRYIARTRDRRQLRFSVSGKPDIELAYRTHWVSPELSQAKRTLSAVVMRFSRGRKRYERQGLLVEPGALAAAEAQGVVSTSQAAPQSTPARRPGRHLHSVDNHAAN